MFFGCNRNEVEPVALTLTSQQEIDGMIQLGKRLENPYTVENMTNAYEKLRFTGLLRSDIEIVPTHYYLRFLPADNEELALLTDEPLDWYDYPLDYEIKEGGTFYHDPTLPIEQLTWQYVVVPIDYKLPKVKYEKICDAFMVGNDKEVIGGRTTGLLNEEDWKMLEKEAYTMTGNLDSEDKKNSGRVEASDWYPSGYIRAWDDVTSTYKPVNRALVRAQRFLRTEKDYTADNGYYRMPGSFSNDVNYSIKWEQDDFDIRDGSYGQAYFNGPKQTGSWNLYINRTQHPKTNLFVNIHNAAVIYYYHNGRYGIRKPSDNSLFTGRLHIAGKDKDGRAHYYNFNDYFLFAAEVVIFSQKKGQPGWYLNTRDIFGVTIHELAHVSHWHLNYSTLAYFISWVGAGVRVPESWATGVEWYITNEEYGTSDYNDYYYQHMTLATIQGKDYKPIVIDLIDDYNQSTVYGSGYPNDQVIGYRLDQIEHALGSAMNWWVWRDKLKEFYDHPTEEHVDYIFENYQ